MFSGIVDHTGILENIHQTDSVLTLTIRSQFADFKLGESISVDGVCLTVIASKENRFECELSPETRRLTIAQYYSVGQSLNLERALRLDDRMSGYWVSGHVDEMITVGNKKEHGPFIEFRFTDFSSTNFAYLIPKGSVSINGVSLTVNAVSETSFSVMLIPHTLERTNLSQLKIQDRVNVEWDYMAKLVAHQLSILTGEKI